MKKKLKIQLEDIKDLQKLMDRAYNRLLHSVNQIEKRLDRLDKYTPPKVSL